MLDHVLAKASLAGTNFTNMRNEEHNEDDDSDDDSDYNYGDDFSDGEDDDYDYFIARLDVDNLGSS
jgi:hypothetical protein